MGGDAWRHYLDELIEGGLLDGDLTTHKGLSLAVGSATITTVAPAAPSQAGPHH